jgi:NADH-quinone oxidoreductase subunit I
MYGSGIVKGMAVTLRHFIQTYLDDIKWAGKGGRYYNDEAFLVRQSPQGEGVITVFYPEEKLPTPERFRFVPFLVTDEPPPGQKWGMTGALRAGSALKFAPHSVSGSNGESCPTAGRNRSR